MASTIDYPVEVFDRVLAINTRGVFLGLKYVLPVMVKQGSGAVINTGSTGSHVGAPGVCAYTASKHAVLGLTRTAALEVAQHGVRVNAICPGHVLTPMTKDGGNFGPDVDLELMGRLSPLTQKGSDPSEMAAAIAFLASDAAVNATGTILTIDGGQTAI